MSTVKTIRGIDPSNVVLPPNATWSNCLVLGNEIALSGATAHPAVAPTGETLSTYSQAIRTLEKIETQLEAAGASRANLYKLVIYLTDIADKEAVNQARAEFFAGLQYPCSTLVGVQALVFPGLSIEIDAFARQDYELPAR